MDENKKVDYRKLFTELIQKQIVILGPEITLAKVRNLSGLTVDSQGVVSQIQGDPNQLLKQLIDQFVDLSGLIVKKTMESILLTYPSMAQIATPALQGANAIQDEEQVRLVTSQDESKQPALEQKPSLSESEDNLVSKSSSVNELKQNDSGKPIL